MSIVTFQKSTNLKTSSSMTLPLGDVPLEAIDSSNQEGISYTVTVDDFIFTQVIQQEPPYLLMVDTVNMQIIPVPLPSDVDSKFQVLELING